MSSADDDKAQMFFQYGNDAALKMNFDYAIEMYQRACKLKPENLVYRQALRGIERRKFQNDPSKVGRLVGTKNQPIRLRARAAKAKKNWANAIEICEEAFVHNPWDIAASRDAAESAEQLGHLTVAQWFLESVQAQANEVEFFRYMAEIHKLNKSWQKAIQAWERVKKIDPNDEIAGREINALSASATIQRANLDEVLETRDALAATVAAQDLEDLKAPKLTPEQISLKEIKENPTRIGPYLQISEYYKGRGQLEDAEKILAQGRKANPTDTTLQLAHSEIQIARLKQAIDILTRRVAKDPGDIASKTKLDQLTTKLNDYEIMEFRRRLGQSTDDYKLHYEIGLRLAKGGRHDEAIASFQQARNTSDAPLKVQALHQVGLSFEVKKAWKLAERAYQDALKSADPADSRTTNDLNYQLGRVAEEQDNPTLAIEHYNEVAANDYSYKDVAQRLQSLS